MEARGIRNRIGSIMNTKAVDVGLLVVYKGIDD